MRPVLLLCLALAVCGCGGGDAPGAPSSGADPQPTPDATADAGGTGAPPPVDAQAPGKDAEAPAVDGTAPLNVARLLYVTNDSGGSIDIFDIAKDHQLLRSVKVPGISLVRGITANPAAAKLWITNSDPNIASQNFVLAYDLLTDQVLWQRTYGGANLCTNPDRLNITRDGKALYVPCKDTDSLLVLDPNSGDVIKRVPIAQNPHNTFVGETGKYMYLGARSNTTMFLFDPATHDVAKTIGPFSSPVRPLTVDASENYVYVNLTNLLGFGVGDINTGKVVTEIKQTTPLVRTAHPGAFSVGTNPHGNNPLSHGIALRPGQKELWFIDEGWGYLYVYDVTAMPPQHKADVPLFSDVTKPWGPPHNRWLTFSIDGKYVYPADGSVVDADGRAVLAPKITASEKLIEIDFVDGKPVIVGGQSGGVYGK